MAGKAWLWEHEVAGHTCLQSEAEKNDCWYSSLISFIQSVSAASENVPPALKVGVCSSVKCLWKHTHRHTQKCVS